MSDIKFSAELARTLENALNIAIDHRHGDARREHLLLALIDDCDAAKVMAAGGVDLESLKQALDTHIKTELIRIETHTHPIICLPTTGFKHTVQLAIQHAQSREQSEVKGSNVLVALFNQRTSPAFKILCAHGMTFTDAVAYISRGTVKSPKTLAAWEQKTRKAAILAAFTEEDRAQLQRSGINPDLALRCATDGEPVDNNPNVRAFSPRLYPEIAKTFDAAAKYLMVVVKSGKIVQIGHRPTEMPCAEFGSQLLKKCAA